MKAVVGCVSWIYSRYTEMVSMDTGHPEAFLILQGDNQQDTWKSSLIRFLPPRLVGQHFLHSYYNIILLGVGQMVLEWFQEC